MRTVAALYIDPLGPYPNMSRVLEFGGYSYREVRDKFGPGGINFRVDCWDEKRDARLYFGPHAIVAHPPCAPWSKMRHLGSRTDRAKYVAARSCAPRALEQVRAFGGVLEHPEHSAFWEHAGLPTPLWSDMNGADQYGGRSYRVEQVSWGHKCRKPTWLYIVGVDHEFVRAGMRFGGTPTHCVTSGPGQTPGLKAAHAAMRSRSPIAFAEWLVSLARLARI